MRWSSSKDEDVGTVAELTSLLEDILMEEQDLSCSTLCWVGWYFPLAYASFLVHVVMPLLGVIPYSLPSFWKRRHLQDQLQDLPFIFPFVISREITKGKM